MLVNPALNLSKGYVWTALPCSSALSLSPGPSPLTLFLLRFSRFVFLMDIGPRVDLWEQHTFTIRRYSVFLHEFTVVICVDVVCWRCLHLFVCGDGSVLHSLFRPDGPLRQRMWRHIHLFHRIVSQSGPRQVYNTLSTPIIFLALQCHIPL